MFCTNLTTNSHYFLIHHHNYFKNENQVVYCAVRIEASNAIQVSLLQPTGYVMHHQFNIQQLYALPTLYLCVLYLPENKQRLVPLTA